MNISDIKYFDEIFNNYGIYIPLRKYILEYYHNNIEETINYILPYNDILVYYESNGIDFLNYTLNFGRNKCNILDHTLNYIIDKLKNNKEIIIKHYIRPYDTTLSSASVNIKYITNCGNSIKKIQEPNVYTIMCKKLHVYEDNDKYYDLYKNFNINDLLISPVDDHNIVGIGYQIHDQNHKKLKLILDKSITQYINEFYNDDYIYYNYDYVNKDHLIKYLVLTGNNHPLLYDNNNNSFIHLEHPYITNIGKEKLKTIEHNIRTNTRRFSNKKNKNNKKSKSKNKNKSKNKSKSKHKNNYIILY